MKCLVASTNPVKINAINTVLESCYPNEKWQTFGVDAPSGVSDQPMSDEETRCGALNRLAAGMKLADADWYAAIEGGVDLFADGPATFAYIVIAHKKMTSVGRSANLPLPNQIYQRLKAGEELGLVIDDVFGTQNIKQKGGAIAMLTENKATRQSIYEQAALLAMAKFLNIELYSK